MKGQVIKSTGSWYLVKTEEGIELPCRTRGRLRTLGKRTTNPVAVGDHVVLEPESDDKGLISAVEERKNYIIRKSPNLSRESQVIASNIDQAILMCTLKLPVTPSEFIDRFLVTAEAYRIPAVLLFNKTDLYGQKELEEMQQYREIYESTGYHFLAVSVMEGTGIPDVRSLLQDRVSLLSGNSGVGKSSLINLLHPELELKTREISTYHRTGKHTTTFAEMHEMPFGGAVIDTPGIKGFGLIDVDKKELYHFFPEIFKASHECKYYNCLHHEEPGCAVREAALAGRIGMSRYINYLTLLLEEESKYRQ